MPRTRTEQSPEHRIDRPRAPFLRRTVLRATVLSLVAALTGAVLLAGPVGATPDTTADDTPSTSQEARQAWLQAAADAEKASEDLLVAQEFERQAQIDAADARVAHARASLEARNAETAALQASAEYSDYRAQLSDFANASFRDGRLGALTALLTAESSTDYLDEVASLDQVADHHRQIMLGAYDAQQAAERTLAEADQARAAAAAAQAKADEALAAAQAATETVEQRKAELDEQVVTYRALFATLSNDEREAAIQQQQAAWEAQARRAAEEAAAQRNADGDGQGSAADNSTLAVSADPGATGELAVASSPQAQIAVDAALSKLGAPYVYGASGPSAYDCSGLTSWAWAQAGVKIPRTSSGQARLKSVPLDQLQPGDLITYYSPVHHVAMYIGNGQIVHASTEGKPVYVTDMYRGGPYPTGHRVIG